ncbi:hypothetical protein PSCFBP3800_01142 [Pseudomonas syringae group genomosp. 3]|uniref:Uncharacterized protein n=1 Tax=Pseudomonas syringae group genomosp. 3 TaxID=251701 RepID=A0A2K4W8J8_9PSED|nr:hypothetical protein CFBP6411_00840 [Pseudomonas syringae group genomosp. 3]SPF11194.1 hypothetical protein PSCFBP3800_01142 [Pseudomonas syringae group genomosp. 3]
MGYVETGTDPRLRPKVAGCTPCNLVSDHSRAAEAGEQAATAKWQQDVIKPPIILFSDLQRQCPLAGNP